MRVLIRQGLHYMRFSMRIAHLYEGCLQAKGQSNGTEAVNNVDGSHAIAESNTQQQHKGKKRAIGQTDYALLKRPKKSSSGKATADLQVCRSVVVLLLLLLLI